jgi:hypothetical protein
MEDKPRKELTHPEEWMRHIVVINLTFYCNAPKNHQMLFLK